LTPSLRTKTRVVVPRPQPVTSAADASRANVTAPSTGGVSWNCGRGPEPLDGCQKSVHASDGDATLDDRVDGILKRLSAQPLQYCATTG